MQLCPLSVVYTLGSFERVILFLKSSLTTFFLMEEILEKFRKKIKQDLTMITTIISWILFFLIILEIRFKKKKTWNLKKLCFYLPTEHGDIVIISKMEVVWCSGHIVTVVFSKCFNTETPTRIFMALIHPWFIYVLILILYDSHHYFTWFCVQKILLLI